MWVLNLGRVIPLDYSFSNFFSFSSSFAFPYKFQKNFAYIYIMYENYCWYLIGIMLNLNVNFGRINIFIILSLPVHEYYMSLNLFRSF